MTRSWSILALCLLGACGSVAASGDGGGGSGVDGGADALVLPDGFTCTPGQAFACAVGDLLTCDATGTGVDRTACRAGCLDYRDGELAPEFHCAVLVPTYLSSSCDVRASGVAFVAIAGTTRLDTTSPSTCTGGIVPQADGPPICVLRAPSFQLPAGSSVLGVGANVLAVVVDDELLIEGVLDVSADRTASGAGGQARESGGQASQSVGGGGAGFRTGGGAGGNGGAAGAALTPTRDTMVAGARAAAASPLGGAGGGGGGGGLILASCRGGVTVGTGGLIDAGGGGGDAGFIGGGAQYAGAGGGSGGFVVLQGLAVTVAGAIYANGGSGGGGVQLGFVAEPGADGGRIVGPTPGGSGAGAGGEGGSGAGGTREPVNGTGGSSGGTPGGGGGAAGRIQIYVPGPAVTPVVTSTSLSPPLEPTGAATYF